MVKHDLEVVWVKLEQILQLKVDCSNFGPVQDIEDSSWVRVQDKDIFSRRVTGRPSDEGARSARNEQGKDILILHEET